MTALPQPPPHPMVGHLWRWVCAPIPLLEDGARLGPVFRLRLWRRTVVGYLPDWNRAVLGDLDTFRSRGSLSGLTPYLAAGVVHTDVPDHTVRRRQLNPHFHSRGLTAVADRIGDAVERILPSGDFEATEWAGVAVRHMLNAALFGGQVPDRLLAAFLAPLQRDQPAPLLPRPRLFSQVDTAIRHVIADPPPATLAAALADLPTAVEDLRVALAAGYDTTAHTLAWAVWHLGVDPAWREPDALGPVVDEVLRLYPAGWIGSRVTYRDTTVCGVALPARTLVLYSPYLTHRSRLLWRDPHRFRPERFRDGRPAWGYVPFAAGRRTCLGTHLARLMLRTALRPFCQGDLSATGVHPGVTAGITLRPAGPLPMHRPPVRTKPVSVTAEGGNPPGRIELESGRSRVAGRKRRHG